MQFLQEFINTCFFFNNNMEGPMHVRGGRGPLQDIFLCYIFFILKR
jgi:hypothetical protein